jgi:glycosyl hydrolase family 12
MRTSIALTVPVTSLLALAAAFACSSEPEGPNSPVGDFGQAGASNTGSAGNTGVPGGAGQPGSLGGGGTESQINPGFPAGLGGAPSAVGGVGGGAAVVDVAPQAAPGGYFEIGAWHGYAWTGDDALNIGTTRSVQDYAMLAAGTPFCLSGVVGPDPESTPGAGDGFGGVALLGFNIQQDAFAAVEGAAPTVGAATPTGLGVAVNYTKTAGQTLRIQLQGPNGETDANQRWCAELAAPQGPDFVLYEDFRTNCWLEPTDTASVRYAKQPISAVVMTVPGGDTVALPYNVCVAGFADGNSEADAPTSISLPPGLLTGTASGEADKFKVIGRDGNTYIINNNAWGVNSGPGTQQIRFTANSFEVLRQTAGPGGDSSPASFPSIYIGANGAQSGVNGATTTGDNLLPIQVSAITSIPTTFRHNATNGDYNATYDVWFAPSPPQGQYDTAQAAFLMVWTYKPDSRVAIGTRRATAPVAGRDWGLFVGPRGGGGPDSNLPVISYVNEGPSVQSFSFDLNQFIDDAVTRGVGLTDAMYLTDVFAGFEIWNGGMGLRVDEFSAEINPTP